MAQLIVRKLDENVKARLKARAKRQSRTLEAEARAILQEAAAEEAVPLLSNEETRLSGFEDAATTEEGHGGGIEAETRPKGATEGKQRRSRKKEKGFGTLMHERFKKLGLTDEEWKLFNKGIEEFRRGDVFKPVDFDE